MLWSCVRQRKVLQFYANGNYRSFWSKLVSTPWQYVSRWTKYEVLSISCIWFFNNSRVLFSFPNTNIIPCQISFNKFIYASQNPTGLRQERPPHLRDGIHPAMKERGRAIPDTKSIPIVERQKYPPPRIIEGRVSVKMLIFSSSILFLEKNRYFWSKKSIWPLQCRVLSFFT